MNSTKDILENLIREFSLDQKERDLLLSLIQKEKDTLLLQQLLNKLPSRPSTDSFEEQLQLIQRALLAIQKELNLLKKEGVGEVFTQTNTVISSTTLQACFELGSEITGAAIATPLTVGDGVDFILSYSGIIDMKSHKILNLLDPDNDQEAASKKYVDDAIAGAGGGIPSGCIIIWSGTIATIPVGYVLCNGANGTPDLRDKFIVGAKQDDGGIAKTNITGALLQTGGAATHIHDNHVVTQPNNHVISAHAGTAVGNHDALVHAGVTVGNHDALVHAGVTVGNHVFTQPSDHANHVHSGPSNHANHVHSGSADHNSHTHTYSQVVNHVHVQKLPNSQTGSQASGTRDTSTTGSTNDALSTNNPTGGVDQGTTNGPSAILTHGNTGNETAALTHGNTGNETAALTHAGGAVDAHAVTQPNNHMISIHAVTQPNNHTISIHAVTQPNAHDDLVHAGTGVDAHSEESQINPFYALAFIMKT